MVRMASSTNPIWSEFPVAQEQLHPLAPEAVCNSQHTVDYATVDFWMSVSTHAPFSQAVWINTSEDIAGPLL